MKNTKRVLAFLVGAAMMMPMVSAESANEYEATAQGFGGPVTVKITVDGGKVTAATITGDKETETIGGAAIKTLTEKLIGVSSADEVDAVASATVTSNAVKTALADCLRQAAGEEKTETALVDGVYTGEGRGFNLTQKVQVTVEIKDGKIASVTVGDNGETMGMIAAVEEKWIPRVVENQSLAVDAICGATASSNGVRAAVVNALESAGMDVSGMYKAIPKVNAAEEYNVDIVVVGMGSSGTTAALALLNDAVKKGGVMASNHVGGLSGAFIPVSEDIGMIEAASAGALTLEKLEAMTCVCSVGLDMIAIPGDTSAAAISGIIADEAAIGMVNNKTTAVRVIPAVGKKAGDTVEFGGLLGFAPVMPVNPYGNEEFVARGGRIPAPLHSLRN